MRIRCQCGAQFNIPSHAIGRRLRCGECRQPVATPVIDNMLDAWGLLGDMAADEVALERRCAAAELPFTEDDKAVALLVTLIGDEDPEVSDEAEHSAGAFPKELVEQELKNSLDRTEGSSVGRLMLVTWKYAPQRTLKLALDRLFDEHAEVRRAAIEIVGHARRKDCVSTIKQAMEYDVPIVSLAAARALWTFENRPALAHMRSLLASEDDELRVAAIRTVASLGSENPLTSSLKSLARHTDPRTRCEAATALGALGESAGLSTLKKLAKDKDEDVRAATAAAVARMGSDKSFKLAVDLARHDPSERVRHAALDALLATDSDGLDRLMTIALDDESDGAASVAALYWSTRDKPDLYERVKELRRSDDPVALRNALLALHRMGSADIRSEILRSAGDADPRPRALGCAFLAKKTETIANS